MNLKGGSAVKVLTHQQINTKGKTMSKIMTSLRPNGEYRWSSDQIIFTETRRANGNLSVRENHNFGASNASIILGPDIAMPGGETPNNAPTAKGYPWNNPKEWVDGPDNVFTTGGWIRGHLVNGLWGGSGADWNNLTPLTEGANGNHSTVEEYMKRYLTSSNSCAQKDGGHKELWYGIWYVVRCSEKPNDNNPAVGHLNSYAPAFIKIDWRAVTLAKPLPTNGNTVNVEKAMDALPNIVPAGVAILPFNVNQPQIPGWPVHSLPVGSTIGANVLGDLPAGYPAVEPNGFDGSIEIHQA